MALTARSPHRPLGVVGYAACAAIGLFGSVISACDDSVGPTTPRRISELSAVVSAPARFVAVGGSLWGTDGILPNTDTTLIVSSSDGITWQTAPVAAAGRFHDVAYGGGLFLAVGSHDVYDVGDPTTSPLLYTSSDGETWQPVDQSPSLRWRAVAYGAGVFVALGIDLSSFLTVIATSPDGASWADDFVTDILSADVTYGDAGFVLWGETGAIGVSTDATDWQVVPVDSVNRVAAVAYLDGSFLGSAHYDCCFGEMPERITYYDVISSDGMSWAVRRRTDPGETFFDYAFGGGRYVALGANAIFGSVDGLAWQRLVTRSRVNAVAYGNDRFVGVGRIVVTSVDGLQWTTVDIFP